MFRLIKWFAYAMLGWVIYELYQGMTQGEGRRAAGGGEGGGMSEDHPRAAHNRDTRRMRLTGRGRGELLTTTDEAGTSVTHAVGRGVVRH